MAKVQSVWSDISRDQNNKLLQWLTSRGQMWKEVDVCWVVHVDVNNLLRVKQLAQVYLSLGM